MVKHYELHICETARDAAYLAHSGLPRYDLEPSSCASCGKSVAETVRNGEIFWKSFGVLLSEDAVTVVCTSCIKPLDKALAAR